MTPENRTRKLRLLVQAAAAGMPWMPATADLPERAHAAHDTLVLATAAYLSGTRLAAAEGRAAGDLPAQHKELQRTLRALQASPGYRLLSVRDQRRLRDVLSEPSPLG